MSKYTESLTISKYAFFSSENNPKRHKQRHNTQQKVKQKIITKLKW